MRALEARDLRALSWSDLLATADDALALTRPVGELRRRYLVPRLLALLRIGWERPPRGATRRPVPWPP